MELNSPAQPQPAATSPEDGAQTSATTPADAAVAVAWEQEQLKLKQEIKMENDLSFDAESFAGLKYVGGVDISFVKDDPDAAAASLVVLEYPSMEVVYEETRAVKMELPYMAGYLAFREVPHLLKLLQVIMVDGNGVLHPRGCGLASHFGVLGGVPTVGVAKKFMHVDGLSRSEVNEKARRELHTQGQSFELVGDSGRVWGTALVGSSGSVNPIYVSIGHRIALDTAVRLVAASCTSARVPEPIRQADQRSREFLSPTGRVLPKPLLEA